jgi:hypothetical protein
MNNESELPIEFAGEGLPPCMIHIDREGDWHHRGSLMHRDDIVSYLCKHLSRDAPTGLYIIQLGKQRCFLEVEDTPLVVTRVSTRERDPASEPAELLLTVKHLEGIEMLDPHTLWIGEGNVLYCTLTDKSLPARFTRPAYYQLAAFVHEDREQGGFYLNLRGERFYIEQRGTADFPKK